MGTTTSTWSLRRSGRAKRLSVTVAPDGTVTVVAPHRASDRAIRGFLAEQAAWIERAVARMRRYKDDVFLPRGRRAYLAERERARALVHGLLDVYAPRYGFRYGRVSIKDLRRNWGSCSELGNLNFNYKIALLPPELAAYVVVHELCHLGQFDHSPRFWSLVARECPDHRDLRRRLRTYHA